MQYTALYTSSHFRQEITKVERLCELRIGNVSGGKKAYNILILN
jgi:hypothetical protein